jgi:hypothetical protein
MLDAQGIKPCWPGFKLFSTSATECNVVESDSKFIEDIVLKLTLIFVDSERGLIPERRPIVVLVINCNGWRSEEALVPVDAPLDIGNCQGVMIEGWKW